MNKLIPTTVAFFCLTVFVYFTFKSNPAIDFLTSLNENQKTKTKYDFNSKDRYRWHYLPATSFVRPGISLKDLDQNQKDLVFKLLKANLSSSGYEKTLKVIELENILAETSGDPDYRDPEKYHIAIYGDPKEKVWAWSFQGHHVALHFTISDGKVAFVPRFLGANPAMIKQGHRKGERTLQVEEDLGFDLINSMSDAQRKKTVIAARAFPDIVTTNSIQVGPLDAEGIKFQELNENQKGILQNLIKTYLSLMPDEQAEHRLDRLRKEDMDEIRFAWAGGFELGEPHYYRVQGKTFLIEFDNTQTNANHIHSVWREFNGDFGRDLLKDHYQNSNHH